MRKLLIIIEILQNINYLSEIAPFFLCLLFYKRIISKEIKVFFVYTIVLVVFLGITLAIIKFFSLPYFVVMVRFFLIFEFILISFVYISIFKSIKSKQFIVLSICLYIIYWIYNFYTSRFGEWDFMPLVVECLFFTLLIVYYFYNVMQYNLTTPLYQLPSFWISVALLLYFSGNFFLFLYSKSMMGTPDFNKQYTFINSTITIIKNVLLSIAIIVNKNQTTHTEHHTIPVDLNLDNFKPFNKSINT
ncbi:hypothetical protein BH11BAC5_BH11BAC5_16540 [soil metagenome]